MRIRGEPSTPEDPGQGKVWNEIVEHAHQLGFTGEFVSVTDTPRETLHHHPWWLGGGGAAELKADLVKAVTKRSENFARKSALVQLPEKVKYFSSAKKLARGEASLANICGNPRGDRRHLAVRL
jgi:hypothetical protein